MFYALFLVYFTMMCPRKPPVQIDIEVNCVLRKFDVTYNYLKKKEKRKPPVQCIVTPRQPVTIVTTTNFHARKIYFPRDRGMAGRN